LKKIVYFLIIVNLFAYNYEIKDIKLKNLTQISKKIALEEINLKKKSNY